MKKNSPQELAPTRREPRDNATKTGVHSPRHWQRLEPLRQQERARVLDQFGFTEDDAPPTFAYSVDRLVEAVLICESYFNFLVQSGGPITTKGRQRRAVDGWMKAADRVTRIAATLGLQRSARPVESLAAYLERRERESEQAQHHDDEQEDGHAQPAD